MYIKYERAGKLLSMHWNVCILACVVSHNELATYLSCHGTMIFERVYHEFINYLPLCDSIFIII